MLCAGIRNLTEQSGNKDCLLTKKYLFLALEQVQLYHHEWLMIEVQ